MTQPREPYSDVSSPGSAPGTTATTGANPPARQVTESMRQLAASALLIGNAVFLFVGLSDLIFVVDGWASEFGTRSAATFYAFAGPVAIALPLLAVLLATHLVPTVAQARNVVLAALGSYMFSAFLGVITYLGAFAGDLFSVRATFDGLLVRAVWLVFLAIVTMSVYRIYRSVYADTAVRSGYAHGPTVYGRPYPGQPMYPQPTYKPGTAEPSYDRAYDPTTIDAPTAETAVVAHDPTVRMPAPREEHGEATRLMRPVAPPTSSPAPPGPSPADSIQRPEH